MHDPENFRTDFRFVDGERIEYEILLGNERLVWIKAGAGGSIRGRGNRYRKMAERVHRRIGATVICASNPDAPHEDPDEQKIRQVVAEMGFSDFEISFIGTSDGAYQNLSLAKRFSETKQFIGINTSYIDSSDLEARLMALSEVRKVLIYGTKDEDFGGLEPVFRRLEGDMLRLVLVRGADHGFTGMAEEFSSLSDYLEP